MQVKTKEEGQPGKAGSRSWSKPPLILKSDRLGASPDSSIFSWVILDKLLNLSEPQFLYS